MATALPTSVNMSLIRFHFLHDTREVDLSQIPSDILFTHHVADLVPTFDRSAFVSEGLLPFQNSQFSDDEVRRYVAHVRLLYAVQNIDPSGIYHHVILEDQIDLTDNFMNSHLDLLNNVPRSYDACHLYVFPQQAWVFDLNKVYESLPQLKGCCIYTVSPSGRSKILNNLRPMNAPYDVMLHKSGLESYTVNANIVRHIDPENGIGYYDPF